MRLSILALLLSATPALADGDLVGSCATPQTDCPVALTRGADYTFHMPESQGAEAQLVDPSGTVVIDAQTPTDGNDDVEFRAVAGGTYRMRLTPYPDGGAGAIDIYTDCRGDGSTQCRIDGTVRGATTGSYDVDAYRDYFRAGVGYAYTFPAGEYGSVTCGDRTWKNHKGKIDFRPARSGVCLLTISRARGPYTLRVR